MVADQIERDVLIQAPVERVWELVTEAEHLGVWFGDAGAEIDLRPGGELTLRWGAHDTVCGRIEVVDPPRRFAWRWIAPDEFAAPGRAPGDAPAVGNSTLVDFTLAAEGDATRLRVVESGFAALGGDEAAIERRYESHVGGWTFELDELAAHAAQLPVGR